MVISNNDAHDCSHRSASLAPRASHRTLEHYFGSSHPTPTALGSVYCCRSEPRPSSAGPFWFERMPPAGADLLMGWEGLTDPFEEEGEEELE